MTRRQFAASLLLAAVTLTGFLNTARSNADAGKPVTDMPDHHPENLLLTDWTPSYRLYGQPHAIWLDGDEHVGANAKKLDETLAIARLRKQYPEFVVYAIPLRDLGQSSDGGFANYEDYWKENEQIAKAIQAFVKETHIIPKIYLEPDALSLSVQYRVDHNNNAESMSIYQQRVEIFKKLIRLYHLAGAKVYLEAGHSGWFDYADENLNRIAKALNEAGIAEADGLATNISNRQPVFGEGWDGSERTEFHYLSRLLPKLGNPKLDIVVDTSRNGGNTQAREYYLAPDNMLVDNEPVRNPGTGFSSQCRLVGSWHKENDGDTRLMPFFGKAKSLHRLLAKEKYTFDEQARILKAPPWLDAVGDVQPGPAPTDHPPAEVASVIQHYRYIKPPDDCDGALNCPPGLSKRDINHRTASRQPKPPTGQPPGAFKAPW